jgi:LPXTG-motif cell wall-anchored protein
MKKIAALLLGGIFIMGGMMTAFAASTGTTGSPQGSAHLATIEVSLPDNVDGSVVIVQSYAEEDVAAVEELREDPLGELYRLVDEGTVDTELAEDMVFGGVWDVSVEGDVTFPVTLTFTVPGVTADSTVVVLHYVDAQWQEETCVLGNNAIEVTFNQLSPIAIFMDADTAGTSDPVGDVASGNTSGTTNSGDEDASKVVAPKTGEAPVMTVAIVVAVIAAAGMVVSVRRKHQIQK